MSTKLKASEKIALQAAVIAIVATGVVYWLVPIFPWWAYLLFGLAMLGSGTSYLLRDAANQKIVDGER